MARKKHLQLTPGWALYLRTSTDESQAPERSQESQRRVIQRVFLKDSDLPVIEEYRDIYSGRRTDRENYQRLLEDARQGKFSFVAVSMVDRFGRNNGEIARAVDELVDLGIKIRLANFPDLDVANAGGRLIVNLLAAVAHFESDRNSERTVEGMLTKLLGGGWTFRVPDGYHNVEERTGGKDMANGRYRRWVEQDPEQAKVWRIAWDLLLEDQLSLKEICAELHKRGFRMRSGRPFVKINNAGRKVYASNTLSRILHNWFYAGWISVDNQYMKIPPKTLRGNWEPIVSTEEFERGLTIIARRHHQPERKKKYFYLLRGMIYLENEYGKEEKLVCSRPNANRTRGGVDYYCVSSSSHNFLCSRVDDQMNDQLKAIQVNEDLIPNMRDAYMEDLDRYVGKREEEKTTSEGV